MKIISVSPKKVESKKEKTKEKLKNATTQGKKIDVILEHLGLKEG